MNAAEKLEIVCTRAWPPLVERPLGGWRLRWAGGFTGRANSALALGDPGMDVPDALREVCDFSHEHGVRPAVQVLRDGAVETAVRAAGWAEHLGHEAGHEVAVLTGPLREAATRARVAGAPTSGWWELTVGTTEPTPAQKHVLTSGEVGYGLLEAEGTTLGAVRGAVVDGWLHVSRLAVHPEFRRRGLATELMTALAAWGRERGAENWVLQVAETNAGALALYSGLGCSVHHRYRYWVPGPGTCEDPTS